MKRTATISILLASIFAFSPVWAGEAATTEETFANLDTDHDGFISMEEAKQLKGLADKFAAADSDGDGKLVLSEFTSTSTHDH